MQVRIEKSWGEQLKEEFDKPYFQRLTEFVRKEYSSTTVYPPAKLIFNAFDSCPFNEVKVVIVGQDPYHAPGQAHGLSFSVNDGIKIPPSLINIYKEIRDDLGIEIPYSGNLERWAKQGVLLLNATLTVRAHQAGSHQNRGWEQFTDEAIRQLSIRRTGLVFLLWGRFAKNKMTLIDNQKHHVLTAAHPSPLSAYQGFLGCGHFSKTNLLLQDQKIQPIDWEV